MYPLYWTTSKGSIFMCYSYEFKRKCVELYREGKYPETPNSISTKRFKKQIREWVRLAENNDFEVLQHKSQNKNWTPEERYELVFKVLVRNSYSFVAISAGINPRILYQWVHKYKTLGSNDLETRKMGCATQGEKAAIIKELVNRGINVNHKRVQRVMYKMELMGKRPKLKYHSHLGNVGKVAENIINRDFTAYH